MEKIERWIGIYGNSIKSLKYDIEKEEIELNENKVKISEAVNIRDIEYYIEKIQKNI